MKSFCWAILLQLCIVILGAHSEELNPNLDNLTNTRQRVFNHTLSSFLENIQDGISEEFQKGAFTYDKDGQPMMNVNKDHVLALSALLMEHDEHYHKDWPGHETVIPDEKQDLARDGHILASSIDDNLTGHVHPKDEDLLQQMMDQPPKLVRARRALYAGAFPPWPEGVVQFVFDSTINDKAKAAINKAQEIITERVPCIKFVPAMDTTRGYLLITNQGAGCWASALGYHQGKSILNLDKNCVGEIGAEGSETIAVHELMHILGNQHEQNRPDRDDYVIINWANIVEASKNNFKKAYGKFDPNEYEYDYKSIMHYSPFSFPIDREKGATIRVKPPRTDIWGHNNIMTETDWLGLRKRYGCTGELENDKEMAKIVKEIHELEDAERRDKIKVIKDLKTKLGEELKGKTEEEKEEHSKEFKERIEKAEFWEKEMAKRKREWEECRNKTGGDMGAKKREEALRKGKILRLEWEERTKEREEEAKMVKERVAKQRAEYKEKKEKEKEKEEQKANLREELGKKSIEEKKKEVAALIGLTLEYFDYMDDDVLEGSLDKALLDPSYLEYFKTKVLIPRYKKMNKVVEDQEKKNDSLGYLIKEPGADNRKHQDSSSRFDKKKVEPEMKSIKEEEEEEDGHGLDDLLDTSNCVVTPWSGWSSCKKGSRARLRYIKQETATTKSCDNAGRQMFLKKCSNRMRRDTGEVAEANMRKTVTVSDGEPIVLIVSNPNNLPVEWYHVIDDEEVEIEKPYTIERTRVGNERIVIEDSDMYDGSLFVAKIQMSNSVLRIFWNVSVE